MRRMARAATATKWLRSCHWASGTSTSLRKASCTSAVGCSVWSARPGPDDTASGQGRGDGQGGVVGHTSLAGCPPTTETFRGAPGRTGRRRWPAVSEQMAQANANPRRIAEGLRVAFVTVGQLLVPLEGRLEFARGG